ncbi:hypothetical protein Hanom_Chr10g00914401 [Helianthus anomalus]
MVVLCLSFYGFRCLFLRSDNGGFRYLSLRFSVTILLRFCLIIVVFCYIVLNPTTRVLAIGANENEFPDVDGG